MQSDFCGALVVCGDGYGMGNRFPSYDETYLNSSNGALIFIKFDQSLLVIVPALDGNVDICVNGLPWSES